MFPDSSIAKNFSCGSDKTAYIAQFGLAPYFKQQLRTQIKDGSKFTILFDESLNKTQKLKQLDVHVRFWKNGSVSSRYYDSAFIGHSRAVDLFTHLQVS
jgi:hypothetical protein